MKATGIVRRIDELGRVVIPKEIRRTLRIREGDPLEIFTDREGEIILKKYSPIGELSDFAREYTESLHQALNISLVCSLEMETSAVKGMEPIGKQELEDCLEAFLVRELNAVFSACRDHGADAFGFGKMAAKEFKQISDWESYGWKQHYPELTADFFVTVRLEDRESTSMLE